MDDQVFQILERLVDRWGSDELSEFGRKRLIVDLFDVIGEPLIEKRDSYEDYQFNDFVKALEDEEVEPFDLNERVRDEAIEFRNQWRSELEERARVFRLEDTPENVYAELIYEMSSRDGVDDPIGDKAVELAIKFGPELDDYVAEKPERADAALKELFAKEEGYGSDVAKALRLSIQDAAKSGGEEIAADQRATADEIRARVVPGRDEAISRMQGQRQLSPEAQQVKRIEGRIRELNSRIQNETNPRIRESLIKTIGSLERDMNRLTGNALLGDRNSPDMDDRSIRPGGGLVERGLGFSQESLDRWYEGQWIDDFDLGTYPSSYGSGSYGSGSRRLTAEEEKEANDAEIKAILAEQFGGFAFFLQDDLDTLNVGLTADGTIVAADDPAAVSTKNVLDVLVEQGIVAPTRVLGILQKTEWFKTTDKAMRQFDATYGEMSEPEKAEFLEPVTMLLDEEAQFLGFKLDPVRAAKMAEQIARQGKEQDIDYIRRMMVAESAFDATGTEISAFAEARSEVESLAYKYYVPVDRATAAQFAEEVYTGERDAEALQAYFKQQATARFPSLDHAINQMDLTPDQYFAPYKYQIEQMLDRTNVDLLEEFPDIIEHIPEGGGDGGVPRPMTMGEMRQYVRGSTEWQNSAQGQDRAQGLAFAIGNAFGEVA